MNRPAIYSDFGAGGSATVTSFERLSSTLLPGQDLSDAEQFLRLVETRDRIAMVAGSEFQCKPTIYVSYTPATSSASKAWPALDRVITSLYAEYFSEQPPTRSALISDFLIDILVEIECLVYRPL